MTIGTKREESPRSLRGAIDRFCRYCLVDPGERGAGTWRQQTEACTAKDCPLYKVRPKSSGFQGLPGGGQCPS